MTSFERIIVHHSGTPDVEVGDLEVSTKRRLGGVPYHFFIDKEGNITKEFDINQIVGGTNSGTLNRTSIQICLIGNFNNDTPTDKQYESLNNLIKKIEVENKLLLPIVGHGEVQKGKGACPGTNFDWTKVYGRGIKTWVAKTVSFSTGAGAVRREENNKKTVVPTTPENKVEKIIETIKKEKHASAPAPVYKKGDYLGEWRVTVYHPCTEFAINDDKAQGGSCDVTASGMPLINEYAGKIVACPPERPIGKYKGEKKTRFIIEGYGEVECSDRGSAIVGKHLDLFVGLGDVGIQNKENGTFAKGVGYKKIYLAN